MAVTKIHAIKASVGKAIGYICNEKKTEEKLLISSFGCAPETADLEFRFLLSMNSEGGPNKAYHLIQSFAPGEVTKDEAHLIGRRLADEVLEGKFPYVLATHVDHDHIHSHIVFCAVSSTDHTKYHDCKKSYYHIREVSDRLCAEHGKSVIKEFNGKGKSYCEWQHTKKGDSWKARIKKDIDECIAIAASYEEFLRLLKNRNYEIKGENPEDGSAKYISFRPLEKDRFVRGRANSLGEGYTRERIIERIEENLRMQEQDSVPMPHVFNTKSIRDFLRSVNDNSQKRIDKMLGNKPTETKLIDTSKEKIAESYYYTKWADKENLKRAAAIYEELGDLGLQGCVFLDERFNEQLDELHDQAHKEKKAVINLEKEIRNFKGILDHAKTYVDNMKYYKQYIKAKGRDKERYQRDHDYQLRLFEGASSWLKNSGVDTSTLSIRQLEEQYRKMIADKDAHTASYKTKEAEYKRLWEMKDSMNKFLGRSDKEISGSKFKKPKDYRDRNEL